MKASIPVCFGEVVEGQMKLALTKPSKTTTRAYTCQL